MDSAICKCQNELCLKKEDCLRFTYKGKVGEMVTHAIFNHKDCKFFISNK